MKYSEEEDTSETLTIDQVTRIQRIIGKIYHYAKVVDHIMLTTLGEAASTQILGTATQYVVDNNIWFLKYDDTHPDANIRYHGSDMVMHIDNNVSELSLKKTRS